jgi:hypothetical protein
MGHEPIISTLDRRVEGWLYRASTEYRVNVKEYFLLNFV